MVTLGFIIWIHLPFAVSKEREQINAMKNHVTSHSELFLNIMTALLKKTLYEDVQNQWSLSRPLFSLMLLNPQVNMNSDFHDTRHSISRILRIKWSVCSPLKWQSRSCWKILMAFCWKIFNLHSSWAAETNSHRI